jgi:hypothetical protein
MSRKIRLVRKEAVRYGLPKNLAAERVLNIGSSLDKNGNPVRGLSHEEEDKLLPSVVSLQSSDPGFRVSVTNLYKNIRIPLDSAGKELEIGLDDYGNPLNIEDYIKYKIAIKHPWFAKSEEEAYKNDHLQFWVVDPEIEKNQESDKLQFAKKAYVEFAKVSEDSEKMDWILRNLIAKYPEIGSISDLVKLKPKDKELTLSKIVKDDPEYFIKVVEDKDMFYKAEIASFVEAGVLVLEGKKYINGTETLGALDSTIAWMKDPNNAESYEILKARLSEYGQPLTKSVKKGK